MTITKQLESEIKQFLDIYWHTYFEGDLQTWSTFISDDYKNIGGTEEEIWNSKKEIMDYTIGIIDQMIGAAEIRNKQTQVFPLTPFVLAHEFCDMYIKVENDWTFYGKFRLSSILKKSEAGWQVIHQHGSYPDSKTEQGEAFAFDRIRIENNELKDAIKRRTVELENKTRELEIEASLERVRTVAMGMNKPDDMLKVCRIISNELQQLGFKEIRNIQTVIIFKEKHAYLNYQYFTAYDKNSIELIEYLLHPDVKKFTETMLQSPDAYYTKTFEGDELNVWRKYRKQTNQLPDPKLDDTSSSHYYFYSIGSGALGITTYAPLKQDQIALFKQFRNAFQLAYSRFTDIQQAEELAREAQIEAALEKVRSSSLAMHHSTELEQVAGSLFDRFVELGLSFDGAFISVFDKEERKITHWIATNHLSAPVKIDLPYDKDVENNTIIKDLWHAIENGEHIINRSYSGEVKNEYFSYVAKYNKSKIPESVRQFQIEQESWTAHLVAEKHSMIGFDSWSRHPTKEEDFKILIRFGKVFEQAFTRFLDLQKAEAQTREAQIEASLERVRSRSMAMHTSNEVMEVAVALFDELQTLDFKFGASTIILMDQDTGDMTQWVAGFAQKTYPESFHIHYFKHPCHDTMLEAWKNGDKYLVYHLSGIEKKSYDEVMFTSTAYKNFPEEQKRWMQNQEAVTFSLAFMKHGAIHWGPTELSSEQANILQRFANVFEQTYTRFLDLQKAEAQAKEAQIEAALERVRSRTMAMQKSSELAETSFVLFQQFQALGETSKQISIGIFKEEENIMELYSTLYGSQWIEPVNLDLDEPVVVRKIYAAWKEQKKSIVIDISGEDLLKYNAYRKKLSNIEYKEDRWVIHIAFFSQGVLTFSVTEPHPDETVQLLRRFALVFDLTYTRFNDLKKAEAQAREAQIETALERVRSRTMGMQKSDELKNVIQIVYEQFVQLNILVEHTGFIMDYKTRDDMHIWLADKHEVPFQVTIPYFDSPHWNSFIEAKEKGMDFFANHLSFKEKNKFYKGLFKLFPVPDEAKEYYFNCPGLAISTVLLDTVGLYIENFSGIPYKDEENKTLIRFGKVFQQTYTRFLDLQKAEAQAREARIEAALERVRSRTLAMQKSDELAETAAVLFKQLITLGIEPNRLYINIIKNENGESEFWITDEDGSKVSSAFESNMNENPTFKRMFEGWREKRKTLTIDMKGTELKKYFHHLQSLQVPFKDGLMQKRRLQYIAYFNKGFIGMASPDEQPEETIALLERFAAVFNLTFTRFNDLKIAEAHALQGAQDLVKLQTEKKRVEVALGKLQLTQKQLIQSEKMASLGELTAGIAHEIQNPLNFVNNFSEVNRELLVEMQEEIARQNLKAIKLLAADLIQNEEKIISHGKRADAIVKGMLQHSRSSTGQKEPTDINALADEYLRLAYHGLRAKDKSFNVIMKTDFDESIEEISINPQEIGRVFLNLITNAFHAVSERKQRQPENFEPMIWISTKKVGSAVEVTVRDNGNGIPVAIREKIFQPFFTTKPTGQGTGLGLSLAYDIVKAHGGELKVRTKEGVFSTFEIYLPIN